MALGALDMASRSKQNRNLQHRTRDRRAKLRDMYIKSVDTYDGRIVDDKIPPEELAIIKRNIRERIARQRRQTFVWAFVFFMLFLALVGVLLWISM